MGATNCPETPRQKMISMMYLVLTALLALNVSAEVLNAFSLFDEALTTTSNNFVSKNESVYSAFVAAEKENPVKTKKWKDIADKLKQKSNEMCEYMDELKKEIIEKGGGVDEGADPIAAAGITKKSDLNVGGEVLVGADEKGKGLVLKNKFDVFREWLISQTSDDMLKDGLEKSLSTHDHTAPDGSSHKWHLSYFDHMPLVACVTGLSKLESDVRNAEADLLAYLYGQIDAGSFSFNKLDGTVIAQSNYVMSGDVYEADIFLAAFDTTKSPNIFIGKYDSTKLEMIGKEGVDYFKLDSIIDGKGKYRVTKGVGYHTVEGLIFFETGKGKTKKTLKFPFSNEFQVAASSVVISPTKMNVFYIGVENPVDISAPGVPSDKIFPSISGGGGRIRRSGKGYVVTVSTPTKNCKVSVAGEVNGSRRSMGSMPFRVKRVPDPVAKVAGQKGGTIAKTKLAAQQGVVADLENFDFKLKFNIIKFTVSATIDGFEQSSTCNGSRFNAKAKNIIKKVKRGKKLYIEDVKAKGPGGKIRNLGSIAFKLK